LLLTSHLSNIPEVFNSIDEFTALSFTAAGVSPAAMRITLGKKISFVDFQKTEIGLLF
jgi:hypothetical protein